MLAVLHVVASGVGQGWYSERSLIWFMRGLSSMPSHPWHLTRPPSAFHWFPTVNTCSSRGVQVQRKGQEDPIADLEQCGGRQVTCRVREKEGSAASSVKQAERSMLGGWKGVRGVERRVKRQVFMSYCKMYLLFLCRQSEMRLAKI